MLRNANELYGYTMKARDGEIGKVMDFYFTPDSWIIRYLVADTGRWLPKRQVLIYTDAMHPPEWENKDFPVDLTREQIENSPPIDEEKPVSRAIEKELFEHYRWPFYGGIIPHPYEAESAGEEEEEKESKNKSGQTNLRSTQEIAGYRVEARNGDIGHIEDMIIDDETWKIRYFVVDTGHWLPGRKVLVSPEWTRDMSFMDKKVFFDVPKKDIEESPPYDPGKYLETEDEKKLTKHYLDRFSHITGT